MMQKKCLGIQPFLLRDISAIINIDKISHYNKVYSAGSSNNGALSKWNSEKNDEIYSLSLLQLLNLNSRRENDLDELSFSHCIYENKLEALYLWRFSNAYYNQLFVRSELNPNYL